MARIMVLGATGSLGKHVTRQAVAAGHAVTALVRTPAKLPTDLRGKMTVVQADLATLPLAELSAAFRGQDAVINTAGLVTEGQAFVRLVDRLVTALESIPPGQRPVCWFMAGAGLLDIDDSGRRGVDLPKVGSTYGPHRVNFERIRATDLDWRELCPGPMVEGPALGIDKLRLSLDKLPVQMPTFVQHLPGALVLPFFALRIPQMIIPYADAAAVILANLAGDSAMSRHRVGLALPEGMRGKKGEWATRPGDPA
ncbi:NAD(P)-dependent oxidoreductase [Pseudomonas sp. N040]|uniref:NAD(P)-dependent oxidoreductase n=1 Tax=Pseudomonas sp. N040 TaxID=2785325 RepID=UPI0018A2E4AC|nr:NAD(P)H-binding protein [Pseudomonas sp. N040]MBF7730474.1 NAD(P)H-binding protein [Pseudomonas sp. N040]MBW7014117.1 NAD(P)H-binding protein [Pseudomonas sp. N040]